MPVRLQGTSQLTAPTHSSLWSWHLQILQSRYRNGLRAKVSHVASQVFATALKVNLRLFFQGDWLDKANTAVFCLALLLENKLVLLRLLKEYKKWPRYRSLFFSSTTWFMRESHCLRAKVLGWTKLPGQHPHSCTGLSSSTRQSTSTLGSHCVGHRSSSMDTTKQTRAGIPGPSGCGGWTYIRWVRTNSIILDHDKHGKDNRAEWEIGVWGWGKGD